MLTRIQFERMADMRSESQIISALADTPYAEAKAEVVETMLARAAEEEEKFFNRYLEEDSVREFFFSQTLASNLKFALRRRFGAELSDELFSFEASPTIEEFTEMLDGKETKIASWLREAAGEVVSENLDKVDPAAIDIIIDRKLVEHQYEVSKICSFLRAFLSLNMDFVNLLTFTRLAISGELWEEFKKAFFQHGSVSIERFKTWWDEGRDSWTIQIPKVDVYKGIGDTLKGLTESYVILERRLKEMELEFLLTTRRLTFGYEPIVGYSLIKREERRNIRRIVTGLRYGLDRETIRSSIAWFE